jgi:hypothetical protein
MRSAILLAVMTGLLFPSSVLAQRPSGDTPGRRDVATAVVGVVVSGTGELREGGNQLVVNPTLDSRFATDVRGQLSYQPLIGDLSLGFNASSGARRYQTGNEFMVLGHSVGTTLGFRVGRRMSVSTSAGFAYMPSYSLEPSGSAAERLRGLPTGLPEGVDAGVAQAAPLGLLPDGPIEATIAERVSYDTHANVNLSYEMSRRLSMNVAFAGRLLDYADAADPGLLSQAVTSGFRFRLNRFATLRLSHRRTFGTYDEAVGGERRASVDDVDVGIDYNYGRTGGTTLALTRSTTLKFNTGLSFAGTSHRSNTEALGDKRSLSLIGSTTLEQRIGRSARLSIGYNRDLSLDGGFTEPVLGNAIVSAAQYQWRRRLAFSASGTATANTVGLDAGADDQYYTFSGSFRVIYGFRALNRQGQAYSQYSVASHVVDRGVQILPTVPRQQFRGSFQIGVTWQLPLITVRSERN